MKIRKNSFIDWVNKILVVVSFIFLVSCGSSKTLLNIFLTSMISLTTFLFCLTINEFVEGSDDDE